VLRPIRSILPDLGGLDISPIILILLIMLIQRIIRLLHLPIRLLTLVHRSAGLVRWSRGGLPSVG